MPTMDDWVNSEVVDFGIEVKYNIIGPLVW